eukprot:TRINITY_DN16957_c0_g1_i1.p1 TRINITY_DN16957_c0_g1~~TRINITY_DN16957_c0_g1_i1.p1  ORF type:complete len:504 (-),score=59.77 TRINITY_DN16957_c0_g1_i1:156-1667(-)
MKTDDHDDHHVNCLDIYSLQTRVEPASGRPHAGPLDALCHVTVDKRHGKFISPSVQIAPGLSVCDLYSTSEKSEVWKDGMIVHCWVPQALVGWEFYSLLWPQPEGTAPLKVGTEGLELLLGRRPGGQVCPSLLFVFIPQGVPFLPPISKGKVTPADRRVRESSAAMPNHPAGDHSRGARELEQLCGNLDAKSCLLSGRIVVAAPTSIYNNTNSLPDDPNWGLFIGPRSRSLVLLNKQRGRIDIPLATLVAVDAVFWSGQNLIEATARLFDVFGTRNRVASLFENWDPLCIHSGFTNATVVDQLSVAMDGRKDYDRILQSKLPSFFVSNASDNLCFLTPQEAKSHRSMEYEDPLNSMRLLSQRPLPDMPCWTLLGPFDEVGESALGMYRVRVPPIETERDLQQPQESNWFSKLIGLDHMSTYPVLRGLRGCSEISKPIRDACIEPATSKQRASDYGVTVEQAPAFGCHSPTSAVPSEDPSFRHSPPEITVVAPPETRQDETDAH